MLHEVYTLTSLKKTRKAGWHLLILEVKYNLDIVILPHPSLLIFDVLGSQHFIYLEQVLIHLFHWARGHLRRSGVINPWYCIKWLQSPFAYSNPLYSNTSLVENKCVCASTACSRIHWKLSFSHEDFHFWIKVMEEESRFSQKVIKIKIMFTSTNCSCTGSQHQTCPLSNNNLEILSPKWSTSTESMQGLCLGLYI